MPRKSSNKAKSQRRRERALLQKVHLNAAGIDIGANAHWVAVPEDRDASPVRSFGVFTRDLVALCDWLKSCQVETIAMESTGVYWIPLYQMLERKGFEVRLVNAHHVKNVPGRKTDVKDCQWLQQLHTFGMLAGSFRPEAQMCVVRSYLRLRDTLSKDCNSLVQPKKTRHWIKSASTSQGESDSGYHGRYPRPGIGAHVPAVVSKKLKMPFPHPPEPAGARLMR